MQFEESVIKKLKSHCASLRPNSGGLLLYYVLPFRKKVVKNNISRVFGQYLTEGECNALAKSFYSHIALSIYENIRSRFCSKESLKESVIVEGYEHIIGASHQQQGILILTGHFGNWEYAPLIGLEHYPEYRGRFYFIRKTLSWQWLEKILFRRFFQAGLRVIPKSQAITKVMSVLSENNVVVFVMDQAANTHNKQGIKTHFFGYPVGTYRSLATVARSSGAPVIPSCSYRRPDGKHVLRFHAPLAWQTCEDYKHEIVVNTECYNKVIESLILEHPEQWLWFHRRWKEVF